MAEPKKMGGNPDQKNDTLPPNCEQTTLVGGAGHDPQYYGANNVSRKSLQSRSPHHQEPKTKHHSRVTIKVGDPLEYRVVRYLIWQGYYARRARDIFTVGYLDQATDLDVYALKCLKSFRHETVIAECKSGADGPGPLDRIFWLSGVKRYVRADRAVLVRRATKWNIKDFAKEVGVEILPIDRLEAMESHYGISQDSWPGFSDFQYMNNVSKIWNKILSGDQYLSDVYFTLSSEVRFWEPFGSINLLIHHMRVLTKEIHHARDDRKSLIAFLICEATGQFAVHLTRLVGYCLDLTKSERQGFINKRLIHGELNPDMTQRIFDHAYRLAQQVAAHYVGSPVPLDTSLFKMPSPDYVDSFGAFIECLIDHATLVDTLAPITDLALSEFVVKGSGKNYVSSIFGPDRLTERLSLVKDFLSFLQELDCLPPYFLEIFCNTFISVK